jgi:hypothetical protein
MRTYCICGGVRNPDKLIVQCKEKSCQTWLHEECILKEAQKEVAEGDEDPEDVKVSFDKETATLQFEAPTKSWTKAVKCLKCGEELD